MKDITEEDLRKAFIRGYERGHDDTVNSCYCRVEDKAQEYLDNVKRGIE